LLSAITRPFTHNLFQGGVVVNNLNQFLLRLRIWKDTRGQDLIEYALMAGFVAVAAGAIMPNVGSSISTIFSQVTSVLSSASSQS
jgi:pilus assembly protein Flp/PilA